jgi:hypothetical protein
VIYVDPSTSSPDTSDPIATPNDDADTTAPTASTTPPAPVGIDSTDPTDDPSIDTGPTSDPDITVTPVIYVDPSPSTDDSTDQTATDPDSDDATDVTSPTAAALPEVTVVTTNPTTSTPVNADSSSGLQIAVFSVTYVDPALSPSSSDSELSSSQNSNPS